MGTKRRLLVIAAVAVALVILGNIARIYLSQPAQQPNIQATDIKIQPPDQHPRTFTALDAGNVSGTNTFTYLATLPGNYSLLFNNTLTSFRTVTLNWTGPDGTSQHQTFQVQPSSLYTIEMALKINQSVTGSFLVAGDSETKVGFSITAQTCTEFFTFSFTLVNSGSDGYATTRLLEDNQTMWENRYFVAGGREEAENGSLSLLDCNPHDFKLSIFSQQKAQPA